MTETHDEPAEISLTCTEPGCGAVVTGPPKGRGSAMFKMGTHRYTKHGLRGDGSTKPKPGEPTDDERADRPILSLVKDAAAQVGGQKRTPTADDLSNALGRAVGIITTGVAVHLVENDPYLPDGPDGDAERDYLVDMLTLNDKAAKDVMRPIGRLIQPTKINQKYGRTAVENVDVIGSFAELATLVGAWNRYLKQRGGGGSRAARPRPIPSPAYVPPGPDFYAAGAELDQDDEQDEPAAPPQFTTPAPTAGRVVTAADVQRMRGN